MEIVEIGRQLQRLEDIPALASIHRRAYGDHRQPAVCRLILHSNMLTSLSLPILLSLANSLTVLDLSSNNLSDMKQLLPLIRLQRLNLSNNQIVAITGLRDMHELIELNLSYNNIESLAGIDELHGLSHSLTHLDIRCNSVREFAEIYHLAGLNHLLTVNLFDDDDDLAMNSPLLPDRDKIREYLLRSLPTLRTIDTDMNNDDPYVTDNPIESALMHDCDVVHQRNFALAQNTANAQLHTLTSRMDDLEQKSTVPIQEWKQLQEDCRLMNDKYQKECLEVARLTTLNSRITQEREEAVAKLEISRVTVEDLKLQVQCAHNQERLLVEESDRKLHAMSQQKESEAANGVRLSSELLETNRVVEQLTVQCESIQAQNQELSKNLDAALNALRLERVKQENLVIKNVTFESQIRDRDSLYEESEKFRKQAQEEIKRLLEQISTLETDKKAFDSRMQKLRELNRLNTDKLNEQLRQLTGDNQKLTTELAQCTASHKQEIESMKREFKAKHASDLEKLIREMKSKFSVERKHLILELNSYRGAFETQEKKTKAAANDHEERMNGLVQEIASFHKKYSEMKELIHDQRNKILDLQKQLTSKNAALQREKSRSELRVNNMASEEVILYKSQVKELGYQIETKDKKLFQLERQLASFKEDNVSSADYKRLKDDFMRLNDEKLASEQAVEIKCKTITEQHEKITELKLELTKIATDKSTYANELAARRTQFENQLKSERKLVQELSKELRRTEKNNSKIQRDFEKLLLERKDFQSEIAELESQVRDRNSMIIMIEEEVEKLRSSVQDEMKTAVASHVQNIKDLESDKANLLSEINALKASLLQKQQVEAELNESNKHRISHVMEINQLKQDIKILLVEMERQKLGMEKKLKQLKIAICD